MTDVASSDRSGRPVSNAVTSRKANLGRWWLPWLLLAVAIAYYSAYALSGLDLGGEGGTTAVIAQRLLDGQRPFVDTFLGYNLLWFYPLVWLFQIFGPNFTVVRIFFFVLSILTALLAYRTVRRVSGTAWLAFVCALVLILIPGIQFRNYLGLLGVGNLAALLEAFALPHRSPKHRLIWIVVAAFAVTLTFLIRIELGFFFCGVTLASMAAYLLLSEDTFRRRLSNALATIIALPVTFLVVHLPVSYYAEQRGFAAAFWEDYLSYWQFIEEKAESVA
ncbi:MAG: glycosyltransferase family 39 protein, partial [Verrucomicrobia bacterium]|nr:glycosyltransferase family 39 protein [Verrucomicrobiota bacterium]